MSQRLDKIGELLAKGIYLCLKKEEKARKGKGEEKVKNNEVISTDRLKK